MATKDFTNTPVAENTAKVVGSWLVHSTFWAMASVELVGVSALDVASALLLDFGASSALDAGLASLEATALLDAGASL